MRQRSNKRRAKARQASKLAEIRAALAAAGFDTTAKQSAVLGVGRSSTWAVLNSDKRAAARMRRKQAFRGTFRTLNLQLKHLKHLPRPSAARPRTIACLKR